MFDLKKIKSILWYLFVNTTLKDFGSGSVNAKWISRYSYFIGIDASGLPGKDPISILILKYDLFKCDYTIESFNRYKNMSFYEVLDTIRSLWFNYHTKTFAIDKNGIGQVLSQALITYYPYIETNQTSITKQSTLDGVHRIQYLLDENLLKIPSNFVISKDILERSLLNIINKVKYKNSDLIDDFIICLIIALSGYHFLKFKNEPVLLDRVFMELLDV